MENRDDISDMANGSPIKWWTSEKLFIGEEKCIAKWDVSTTRGKPIIKFRTMDKDYIKALAINTCMHETNYRRRALVINKHFSTNTFISMNITIYYS